MLHCCKTRGFPNVSLQKLKQDFRAARKSMWSTSRPCTQSPSSSASGKEFVDFQESFPTKEVKGSATASETIWIGKVKSACPFYLEKVMLKAEMPWWFWWSSSLHLQSVPNGVLKETEEHDNADDGFQALPEINSVPLSVYSGFPLWYSKKTSKMILT